MPRQLQHPGQIMLAGHGRLRHHQHAVRTGHRGDHRTSDTGRPVGDDQRQAPLFRHAAGFLPDRGHQLAGVFCRGGQTGMDHGAATRLREHPFAAKPLRKIDGLCRAEPHAHAAPLAGDRIDLIEGFAERTLHIVNRVKAAQLGARPAASTGFAADHRFIPAPEIRFRDNLRRQHQMQVRRIHIAIGQHGASGRERREGGRHAGLAGAALAADDHTLLNRCRHRLTSLPNSFIKKNVFSPDRPDEVLPGERLQPVWRYRRRAVERAAGIPAARRP